MDLIAEEVMQRNVQTIHPDVTLPELEKAFLEARVGGFPVVEAGQLVGVVSRSDVVRQLRLEHEIAERVSEFYLDSTGFHESPSESIHAAADRVGERIETMTVREVMHRSLFAVSGEQPLRQIAEMLVDNRIHRVLVTKDGRLIGLISALDIVRLCANGRLRAHV